MRREEQVFFPLILAGGPAMIGGPIAQMRQDHRQHGAQLERVEEVAHGFHPPYEACRSWHALYAGVAKLVDDVREHIHLENNVLFPRFQEPGGA